MSKAVVFTHFSVREETLDDANKLADFIKENSEYFKTYLTCQNIGLVYVYVSRGLEKVVKTLRVKGSSFEVNARDIDTEQRIISALRLAIHEAAGQIPGYDECKSPQIIFIGLPQLVHLLNTLIRIDKTLVRNLAGRKKFTYDSPKFVDAVIRLKRGNDFPVVRVDADVCVNEDAMDQIIAQWELLNQPQYPHNYFFSGNYAGPPVVPSDSMNIHDPVNMHAIRQHWLVDPKAWTNPVGYKLVKGAEQFARDIGELGATQVVGSSINPSRACKKLIKKRGGLSMNRERSAQAISGAGLVMSVGAIRRLPPFMNAQSMIVWIDDHLKRQLHEAIQDIPANAVERLNNAYLIQNRSPKGIAPKDIEWAKDNYFERLLSGCLMHAMIKNVDGTAGPLANIVKDIIEFEVTKTNFTKGTKREHRKVLRDTAKKRFEEVLGVWRNADYGETTLKNWADKLTGPLLLKEKNRICFSVVNVAMDYIKLLFDWPQYLNAIDRLGPKDAFWLFTPVR